MARILVLVRGENMYILTLIKANLRHKKANFISIMVLMFIISILITAAMGISKETSSHIDEAFDNADIGDLMLWYVPGALTDDDIKKITDLDEIEKVDKVNAVYTNEKDDVLVSGKKAGQVFDFQVYDKDSHPFHVYNDQLSGFLTKDTQLKQGEIYIPVCFTSKYSSKIGDKVEIKTDCYQKTYTVKGFLEEPTMGNPVINGYKNVFLSKEDFDELYEKTKEKDADLSVTEIVQVYCKEDTSLSDNELNILLNDTARMIEHANTTVSRLQFKNYSSIIINIFIAVLCIFAGILFLVVLIIMGYNISTSIEMDYVNLGILKSQGFFGSNLRKVYIIQYTCAQVIVGAIGCLLGGIVAKVLASILVRITGLLLVDTSAMGISALIILGMCVISGIVVFFKTIKISKVSPMIAILERQEISLKANKFRMKMQKSGLVFRMAVRQMTSNMKQYLSSIIIVALLLCFMLIVNTILTCFDKDNILNEFYGFTFDLEVEYKDMDMKEEIEDVIKEYSDISLGSMFYSGSFTVDNTSVLCNVVDNADRFVNIFKGKAPAKEDEVVITEVFGETYNVALGDTLKVSYHNSTKDYKIVGYYQSVNKAGMQFSMLESGAKRLDPEFKMTMCDYTLKNPDKAEKIAEVLKDKYSEKVSVETLGDVLDSVKTISDMSVLIVIIVDIVSVLFVLIVAYMICNKVFTREKKDFGIYKAFGFTSIQLRVQFALRFLVISLLGTVIGVVISLLCNKNVLSMVLKIMGITNFNAKYTLFGVLGPVLLLCFGFTAGAFITSRRMKKIDTRMLIVE